MAKHRLFYALMPSPDDGRRMLGGVPDFPRKMLRERLHLTVAITPEFDLVSREIVEALLAAGGSVSFPPIDIILDRMTGNNQSIALGTSGRQAALREFSRQIAGAMRRHGVPLHPKAIFNPHVTVAYRDGEGFTKRVRPIAWRATQFVLIESLVGETTHREIGRWPLDGAAPLSLFDEVAA